MIDAELPMIGFWMDQPLTDLSKEELIAVVMELGRELQQARDHHRQSLAMWSRFNKSRNRMAMGHG